MRGPKWLALAATILAVPVGAAPSINGFKHSSWTPEQGAPSNVVGIAQTRDGYLWLASAEGVFRFDGLSFEQIASPSDVRFRSAIPTSIFVDRAGRTWVGYNQGAGIAVYFRGRLRAVPMTAPPPSILKFAQGSDGGLWASWGGQGDRLFRLAGGRWRAGDRALALPPGEIAALATSADGSLWVTLGRSRSIGTLARLPRGAGRFVIEPDRLGFTMLGQAPDGALWISDRASTRLLRDRGMLPPRTAPAFPAVAGAAVPTLAFDRRGGIWGTTRGVGLFRIDPRPPVAIERLTVGQQLTSDATIETFVDREGSIWVATDAGLDRYRPVPIARLSSIPADVQDGVKLARDATGAVVVASAHALYRISSGSDVQKLRAGFGRIGALCPAVGGGVWTTAAGRITRQAGAPVRIRLPPDPVAPTICAEDRRGRLWLDGEGVVWLRDGDRWRGIVIDQSGRGALDIVPDPGGNGVIATVGRAQLLRLGSGEGPGATITPGVGSIGALWRDGDAILAAGADGIARIDTRGVRRILSAANPWLVGVRGMARDAAGNAWFLVRLGIVRVARGELERGFAIPQHALSHRLFDSHDGYTTRGQAISFRGAQMAADGSGRIVIATRAGPLLIDPAEASADMRPPPVVIRSVSAAGRVWRDPTGVITLPAGERRLHIAFSINSLAVPVRNRAFYRLDGQDGGWIAAGVRREASYTNLGPGRHVFQVVGMNGDGAGNRHGASIAIVIPPTFVQSWPFKLLCAVLAGGLLWLAYVIRLRIVARQIRSRMLDRLRERERVARDIHDTLLQSIQALMLRFQRAADTLPAGHAARSDLEAAMDQADDVVAEGRDRLRDLRRADGLNDPEGALRDLAGRQLAGTVIQPVVRSLRTVRPIDPIAWDELANIAGETMINVARHAHASQLTVELVYQPTALVLRIIDDGIGIPEAVARDGRRDHYGIPGMRERAARIGGVLRIERRREGGTEVAVTVPAAMAYRGGRLSSDRWHG